jgi:hypothetical protein
MPDPTVRDLETGYYVYGVVPVLEGARPSITGIDDAEVQYVEHEDVAAAVAVIALERPPGRRAELMAHSAVVEALSERGPVVPVQFGSVMEDRDSVVHDLLERDHGYYVDLLERLRGLHQFRLQGTYVQDQVLAELVAQRPDIADLRRRTRELPDGVMHPALVELGELVSAAMDQLRAQDADSVLDVVEPLVVATRHRRSGGVDGLLDVALLVEDARAEELESALESLAEAVHERIRLSLSGPMAPFDFVEGEPWD